MEERPEPGRRAPHRTDQLNTYDVLNSDDVVFSLEALNTFIAGPAKNEEESK